MKDLGAATAYAYAVEEGYTGTEEEFAELMADFTTAAETATTAAEAAEAAAASLTVDDELDDESTNPVQNAVITNELSDLKDGFDDIDDRVTALEEGGTGSGLTDGIKQALLQIAEKVAYIDEDGQDYYDALNNALYPPANLVSISAVYTQSGTVYDTDSLNSLKDDLVVTALYDDRTTETVTTYTLSGTLTTGTSTITVTYGGKTATFDVVVTMSRATKFGMFEANAIGKVTNSSSEHYNWYFRTPASARARMVAPIKNHNYVFTVTDSTKYKLAAKDITSNVEEEFIVNNDTVTGYAGGTKSVAWATTDSVSTEYVWLALQKLDNTEFTSVELANGAEAVFTFTES